MNYLSPEAKQNARSAAMAIFNERRANAADTLANIAWKESQS